MTTISERRSKLLQRALLLAGFSVMCAGLAAAQTTAPAKAKSGASATAKTQGGGHDPAEPPANAPHPKILPRPTGAIPRSSFNEKNMRDIIHEQVSCGTRLTLSSWTDPKRGIGCGRDFIMKRFNDIAAASNGKLEIVWDISNPSRSAPGPIPCISKMSTAF